MWMLLERVRFTLDGIECNKIGVNYEAFNQLWNFREVGTATIISFFFNYYSHLAFLVSFLSFSFHFYFCKMDLEKNFIDSC